MFEVFDYSQALAIMLEATVMPHETVQDLFAGVPERCVSEVVSQRDGFCEVFVKAEGTCDIASDGGHFHGVGKPGSEMITSAIEEHLGFVFEPPERTRMNYPVAVALVMGAPVRRRFVVNSAAGIGAELCVGSQREPFPFFEL